MTSEEKFAKKLTGYLDAGTANLRAGAAYRLQSARAEALARLSDPKRAPAMQAALAGAARTGTYAGPTLRIPPKLWIGVALLVAVLFGYNQWQAYQQMNDLAETDAALLSSDLPIDAYLDRGFQIWLKSAADSD
jgi:hypothetical protein